MKDKFDKEEKDLEVDTDPGDENRDDVSFEEEIENTAVDHQKKTDQLKAKLKEAEEKAAKYLESWQRDKADFINIRKRDEVAQMEFVKFANEKLILEIITVLDHFNVALTHVEGETKKGIEQIRNQFVTVLEKNGVKKFSPIGETFDPSRAQAITMLPVENETDDHKVMEVIQPGYELNNKIIRPAMVKVGNVDK